MKRIQVILLVTCVELCLVLNILVTLLGTEVKSVPTRKLDKIVENIYSRIDDGMIPSNITSPDTTICILSGKFL